MKIEDGAWFVRSNGGRGSYPINKQGWMTVWGYLGGIAALGIVSLMLMYSNKGPMWLWIGIFGIGMLVLAYGFIQTARQHTDFSITYDEYRKRNAGH